MRYLVAVFLLMGLWGSGVSASLAQDCDRQCLSGHLESFLPALIEGVPEEGGLAYGFRQAENARAIPLAAE